MIKIKMQNLKLKTKIHQSSIINHKSSRGFTLVELLIVIAIIGVLSALLVANFIGVRQRARDAERKSDLRQIQSALEIYRSDQDAYPTCNDLGCNFQTSCGDPLVFGTTTYMTKIPCDPFGTKYSYVSGGTTYILIACLENTSDSQKDDAKAAFCTASNTASYTLNNP